jgi:hypothetical protein
MIKMELLSHRHICNINLLNKLTKEKSLKLSNNRPFSLSSWVLKILCKYIRNALKLNFYTGERERERECN